MSTYSYTEAYVVTYGPLADYT